MFGRYHDQEPLLSGVPSHEVPEILGLVKGIGPDPAKRIEVNGLGLIERDSVLEEVGDRLGPVPVVSRHGGTIVSGTYLGLIW